MDKAAKRQGRVRVALRRCAKAWGYDAADFARVWALSKDDMVEFVACFDPDVDPDDEADRAEDATAGG